MSEKTRRYYNRALILLFIAFVSCAWTMINAHQFIFSAFVYMSLALACVVLYLTWNKWGKKVGVDTLKGIDDTLIKDILIGVGIFAGYYLIKLLFPNFGAITLPLIEQSISAGDIGIFVILVIGAGIVESCLFHDIIIDFFDEKFKIFGKKFDIPYFIATILTSIIFMLFHYLAYTGGGAFSSASGSFISAFLVSCVWCYTRKWTNSILPLIISHGLINFYILSKMAVFIG